MQTAPVIGVVAGEASGDLLGAHLIRALKAHRPELHFEGIAGPAMVAAGATALFSSEKLAVRGYVEVIRRLPEIISIRRRLTRHFLTSPPRAFIGIDAPDFNLDLELTLRTRGVKVIHYASPSIWAWRGERIHKIKRAVDHMLALFPFEPAIYEKAGVPVTYVGHPLADMLAGHASREVVRARLGLTMDVRVVALLPGSRESELAQLGALFAQTAKQLCTMNPQLRFVAPMVNMALRARFEAACREAGLANVLLLDGASHDAMAAADVVLVASGTATLEAALLQRPMVIAYRVPWLSAWLTKRRGYVPYIGLPNILAGDFVVPELLQEAATPDALAREVSLLLNDANRCDAQTRHFSRMLHDLKQDTAARAAEAVLPYLAAP
jgi:lipid-A-disaccharide synthase